MAKITIPRLVPKRRRSKTYWYWVPSATLIKAGWKPIPLGTDEFAAAKLAQKENEKVDEWRGGGAAPRAVKKFNKTGTVDQLIARFKEEHFPNLRETTQKEYRSKLEIISKWAGKEQAIHIRKANVRKLRDALMKPGADGKIQHNRAAGTLRVLRTLMAFAETIDAIPEGSNPAVNPGMKTPDPRQQYWTPEAVDAFCEDANSDIDVAVHLGREIGQREDDLLTMSIRQWVEIPKHKLDREIWEALAEPDANGRPTVMGIRIRQAKSIGQGRKPRWIEIPVVGETRRKLEAAIARSRAAGCTTILTEQDRESTLAWHAKRRGGSAVAPVVPWDVTRFQRAIAEQREATANRLRKAGELDLADVIAALQFRDLRRTAVVWLGELGIEDHLIAAITGHSLDHTKKILETYMPRTGKMAARAIVLRLERTAKPEDPANEEKQA